MSGSAPRRQPQRPDGVRSVDEEPTRPVDAYASAGSCTAVGAPISGLTILPLRLFLGATFVYAGYQKITDPGFFKAGSRTYIGTQMLAFSRGSPIQFVLHKLMEHAVA